MTNERGFCVFENGAMSHELQIERFCGYFCFVRCRLLRGAVVCEELPKRRLFPDDQVWRISSYI